jgi:hypothetical protein
MLADTHLCQGRLLALAFTLIGHTLIPTRNACELIEFREMSKSVAAIVIGAFGRYLNNIKMGLFCTSPATQRLLGFSLSSGRKHLHNLKTWRRRSGLAMVQNKPMFISLKRDSVSRRRRS